MKLSAEEFALLENNTAFLSLISGGNGTVKINGTGAITTPFRAIYFSENTTVTAIADNATPAGDKDTYFTATTYTAKAGDIIVADNMRNGGIRIVNIELASGSAVGIK
jgi:hypothetical protein